MAYSTFLASLKVQRAFPTRGQAHQGHENTADIGGLISGASCLVCLSVVWKMTLSGYSGFLTKIENMWSTMFQSCVQVKIQLH